MTADQGLRAQSEKQAKAGMAEAPTSALRLEGGCPNGEAPPREA